MEFVVTKAGELWEYAEKKVGKEKATPLLAHLGFDNPHILKKFTIDECKKMIDKYIMFNEIVNKK